MSNNRVSNVLTAIFGSVVLIAMIIFGKIYTNEGVFVVNSNIENRMKFICLSITIVLILNVYQSTVSTILIKKNRNLIEDLSETVGIFFETFLRKDSEMKDSIEKVEKIAKRNSIKGDLK